MENLKIQWKKLQGVGLWPAVMSNPSEGVEVSWCLLKLWLHDLPLRLSFHSQDYQGSEVQNGVSLKHHWITCAQCFYRTLTLSLALLHINRNPQAFSRNKQKSSIGDYIKLHKLVINMSIIKIKSLFQCSKITKDCTILVGKIMEKILTHLWLTLFVHRQLKRKDRTITKQHHVALRAHPVFQNTFISAKQKSFK